MACATLVTPNLPELEALGGEDAVLALAPALLIKGGHAGGDTVTDRLVTRDGEAARWSDPRIDSPHTHGTGCTLSSAIATLLGQGASLSRRRSVARALSSGWRCAMRLRWSQQRADGAPVRTQRCARPRLHLNQITLGATDYAASVAFYRALGSDARSSTARPTAMPGSRRTMARRCRSMPARPRRCGDLSRMR